jgi:N utilization substance protein B
MSTRRRARELALCALYAFELSGNPLSKIFNDLFDDENESEDICQFCIELTNKTFEHHVEFDNMIKTKALNWDFNRIAIIDRIILRIAMCEFLYFDDIPPKVSIDEAIEISKKYSTEKSGKFINGILDSVLSQWKSENIIVKSGRGLVEGSMKKKKNEPFDPHKSKTEIV